MQKDPITRENENVKRQKANGKQETGNQKLETKLIFALKFGSACDCPILKIIRF